MTECEPEYQGYTDRFARSRKKIRSAFAFEDLTEPPIVVWPLHYIIFGTAVEAVPEDLFDDPAHLVEFQVRCCERHLSSINDDFIPYLTPYYGTGILASAFGAAINFAPGRDPAVAGPCLHEPADAAKLRLPNPESDGLMPRVLETAAYMHDHGPYPVSLTDSQSPLDELILMCGHERLYMWMYDEPAMVHDLFELATEAFILWVKAQKAVTDEPWNVCHGEQGVWVPEGCGVWLADDEAVNLSPGLYAEYVSACYARIFKEFGGGILHFCGDGSHHAETLLAMEGLRAINSGPMGRPHDFVKLQRALNGRIPLIYQEMSPLEPEIYFRDLIDGLSPRGVIFAPQVSDRVATASGGGFAAVEQDRFAFAHRVKTALEGALNNIVHINAG